MDDGFEVIVIGELGKGTIIFWYFVVCRNDDMLSIYISTLMECILCVWAARIIMWKILICIPCSGLVELAVNGCSGMGADLEISLPCLML